MIVTDKEKRRFNLLISAWITKYIDPYCLFWTRRVTFCETVCSLSILDGQGVFFFTSSVYMLVFMALQTAFSWRCVVITMVIIGQMSLVKSVPKAVVLMVSG